MADADERRLFYVAMTRAKHQVVLLAHQRFPSPYALELLHTHRDGTVLFEGTRELPPHCPKCDHGLVFKQYNPKKRQWFHACSHRWSCGKTWTSWPPVKALARSSGVA
ncbi:ATP-binding domain-containing protein [Trinickia dinghuensis]|uniref:ATP-binding domain-containing protein n=1 Tax=Trinickia dinghuensis TaxID=2291023 RepID=UPI001FEABB0C|nr:ATP-binding domain-containing protein [Trinickia dinghuensis]